MPQQLPVDVILRNNVKVLGATDRPVLVYAHGFGCSQDMWKNILPAYSASHCQVVFDYVGNGASDRSAFSEKRYGSLEGYATDLIEVCDALGLTGGVTLVAHSVSCNIGMLAHQRRPELFEAMVMLGPSPCYLNLGPEYAGGFERHDLEELLALMDQNYIGWASYLSGTVAGDSEATAADLNASFCSTDPEVARIFAAATFFADNRADLATVSCPALVLQHAHDALVPVSIGEYVARTLPSARFEVLPVHGHCAHMSHPDLVIAAMNASGFRAFGGSAGQGAA